ncbi:MAG: hypothetical protein ACXV8Q_01490 [Methylobacter sp.]
MAITFRFTLFEISTEPNLLPVQFATWYVSAGHRQTARIDTYRYVNTVPLHDADDALLANWCELTTRTEDGQCYKALTT